MPSNPLAGHPPWRQLGRDRGGPARSSWSRPSWRSPGRPAGSHLATCRWGSSEPRPNSQRAVAELDRADAGAFDFRLYTDQAAARAAIRDREVYGAFVVTPTGSTGARGQRSRPDGRPAAHRDRAALGGARRRGCGAVQPRRHRPIDKERRRGPDLDEGPPWRDPQLGAAAAEHLQHPHRGRGRSPHRLPAGLATARRARRGVRSRRCWRLPDRPGRARRAPPPPCGDLGRARPDGAGDQRSDRRSLRVGRHRRPGRECRA